MLSEQSSSHDISTISRCYVHKLLCPLFRALLTNKSDECRAGHCYTVMTGGWLLVLYYIAYGSLSTMMIIINSSFPMADIYI